MGARRNASALAAPACARWAPSLPACTAVSAPPSAPAPPPVSALTSTSSTPCTSSVSFRSSVSEVIKVGRPMTPMANWATRDSCTRFRSSCAAERRSSARTPSLMRSRSAWDREHPGDGSDGSATVGAKEKAAGWDGHPASLRLKDPRFVWSHLRAAVVDLVRVHPVAVDDDAAKLLGGAAHALLSMDLGREGEAGGERLSDRHREGGCISRGSSRHRVGSRASRVEARGTGTGLNAPWPHS